MARTSGKRRGAVMAITAITAWSLIAVTTAGRERGVRQGKANRLSTAVLVVEANNPTVAKSEEGDFKVWLDSAELPALANDTGRVWFTDVRPGRHVVRVKAIGWLIGKPDTIDLKAGERRFLRHVLTDPAPVYGSPAVLPSYQTAADSAAKSKRGS